MAPVTNRVDPASLAHLLAAPPRATLTWIQAERLELAPVRYRSASGRHFVALAEGAPAPPAGAPASLVLDDGWSWFELRAVTLRGTLIASPDAPMGAGARLELVPERMTAWDYGSLHREPGS